MADATRPSLTKEACAKLEDYLEGLDILIWEHEAWKDDDWSKLTSEELSNVDEYFQVLDVLMAKIVYPSIEKQAASDDANDAAVAQASLMLKLGLYFAAAKAGDFAPWLTNVLNQDTQES